MPDLRDTALASLIHAMAAHLRENEYARQPSGDLAGARTAILNAYSDAMLAERIDALAAVRVWDAFSPLLDAALRSPDTRPDAGLREAALAVVEGWVDDESGMETFDPELIDRLAEALAREEAPDAE